MYKGKKQYKQNVVYQNSLLSNTQTRCIEINAPIYLRGTGGAYPALGTYAAYYSFQIDTFNLNFNNYFFMCLNLLDTVTPYAMGRSKEYLAMKDAFTHVKVDTVLFSFVRSFVSTTDIYNLPPLSLSVVPTAVNGYVSNSGSIDYSINNYFRDGNSYYQPVNTVKDVDWTSVDFPKINVASSDSTLAANQWFPAENINSLTLAMALGQSLPAITQSSTSGYIREIGMVSIRLMLTFGIPQIS